MAGLLDLFARLFSQPPPKVEDLQQELLERGALMEESSESHELQFLDDYTEYWRCVMSTPEAHPETEGDLYVNMTVIGEFIWIPAVHPLAKVMTKTCSRTGEPVPEAICKTLRAGKCIIYELSQVQQAVKWAVSLYIKHKRMEG